MVSNIEEDYSDEIIVTNIVSFMDEGLELLSSEYEKKHKHDRVNSCRRVAVTLHRVTAFARIWSVSKWRKIFAIRLQWSK